MSRSFSNINFTYPWALFVGWLFLIRYLYRHVYRKDLGIVLRNNNFQDQKATSIHRYTFLKHLLRWSALFLFFILFSQPVLLKSTKQIARDGIDIVFVLDISNSMLAEDLVPNRLDVAKETIQSFVQDIVSDRLWLVVFAWKPFTLAPLSFDYNFVSQSVFDININTIDKNVFGLWGTAIWESIIMWINLFEDTYWTSETGREKIIILLSDGSPTQWTFDINSAAVYAKSKWVSIYTIWIGSPNGTLLTIKKDDEILQQTIPWINEEIMNEIASITNGVYYNAWSTQALQKIFGDLHGLTTSEIIVEQVETSKSLWRYVLSVLIFLFVCILFFELILKWKQTSVDK